MVLTEIGLAKVFQRVKSFVIAQLNSKASVLHTHTKSEITDFPTIPSKTSDLTNDSGFLTSHQDLSGYIPKSGSNQISGDLIPSSDGTVNLGSISYNFENINTKFLSSSDDLTLFSSFNGNPTGSFLTLKKIDSTSESGSFQLNAHTETQIAQLIGYPDGTLTWGGTIFTNGIKTYSIESRDSNNSSVLYLLGGSSYPNGAQINLYGNNHQNNGCFEIIAHGDSQILRGEANGTLTWGSKHVAMAEDVVPRSGGAVIIGNAIGRISDDGSLRLDGGTGFDKGSSITIHGKDLSNPVDKGKIYIHTSNGSMGQDMFLYSDGTWTWSGQPCQTASDQRLKQQITQIDNALLDAWSDVDLVQFKYNDAVNEKGDKARLHTGFVVQQIDSACKKHGVDISTYGLYCHEVYPEETEEIEVEQKDGTKTKETKVIREASEHYSLRYTETLVVECAYLRRENARLKENLANLEERLEKLEKAENQEK